MILSRKIEFWFVPKIENIVETCVLLHNAMVETRTIQGEEEREELYSFEDTVVDEADDHRTATTTEDLAQQAARRLMTEVTQARKLSSDAFPHISTSMNTLLQKEQTLAMHLRWKSLYSCEEHFILRKHITEELYRRRESYRRDNRDN